MRYLCAVAALFLALGVAPIHSQAKQEDQRAVSAWVQRLASMYDIPEGSPQERTRTLQSRFLNRMSGMPAGDELQKLAGDLISRVGYQELVLTMPAFGPLWKGTTFQGEYFNRLVSRASQLTPERQKAWTDAISTATKTFNLSPAWVALMVLDTDQLFPANGYNDMIASNLMERLKSVPFEASIAAADAVGISPGQAAMYLVVEDWAFGGTGFRTTEFEHALKLLRNSAPPKQ